MTRTIAVKINSHADTEEFPLRPSPDVRPRRSQPFRHAVPAAATAAVALAVLAACSSGSSVRPTPAPSSTAPVVSPTISPTQPQHPIPSDTAIVEQPELRNTIALTGCAGVDGGWAGSGTAKNPDGAEETYRILVFFTDRYSRTIDSATTEVTVPAGKTATWSAAASFVPPAGTQCVLRGLSKN